jgi:cell division protein FtsB
MEFLVPLMPLFGTLPFALAAAWIAHRILRHRERFAASQAEMEQLRQEVEALRTGYVDLQERLDFTERMLAQVRDGQHGTRALE